MTTFFAAIDPNKSLRDVFGTHEVRQQHKGSPEYLEYAKAIRRLLAVAEQFMLDPGEVLLYINRSYGYVWDTIPFNRFEDIETVIRKNWYRMIEFLQPADHAELMATDNEYSRWYTFYSRSHKPKEPHHVYAD